MPVDLTGKTALVTGAASGIGRASALAFARAGAAVAILDIDAAGLEATAEVVSELGAPVDTLHTDVTDLDAVTAAVDLVIQRFGRLDAAHNNAGVAGAYLPIEEYPSEEFLRVIQTNLVGVWHCMRAEITHMRRQGGAGAIVNTSSMLGEAAMPYNGAYIAAKHGVHGLTKAAAIELGDAGIRVNALAPGVTRTGLTSEVSDELLRAVPMGRIAAPEEIAAAAVWLCSAEASYVTGSVLVADGGWLAG